PARPRRAYCRGSSRGRHTNHVLPELGHNNGYAAFASPRCASKHETPCLPPLPRRWLSFLVGAIVTGIGEARHVEFDRVAAFVASGHKATKDETAKVETMWRISLLLGGTHAGRSLAASAAPVKQARP